MSQLITLAPVNVDETHKRAVSIIATNEQEITLSSEDDEVLSLASDTDTSVDEDVVNTVPTEREIMKAAFLNHVEKTSNDESQFDATVQPTGNNVVEAESTRIIDRVRDYQQELFERAKEENVIAV